MMGKQIRSQYTLEDKLEGGQAGQGRQSIAVTARVLGMAFWPP